MLFTCVVCVHFRTYVDRSTFKRYSKSLKRHRNSCELFDSRNFGSSVEWSSKHIIYLNISYTSRICQDSSDERENLNGVW